MRRSHFRRDHNIEKALRLAEHPGNRKYKDDLYKLRRLDADKAKVKPKLRAVGLVRRHQHDA